MSDKAVTSDYFNYESNDAKFWTRVVEKTIVYIVLLRVYQAKTLVLKVWIVDNNDWK